MSEFTTTAAGIGDEYLAALSQAQEQFLQSLAPYSGWASGVKMPASAPNMPTPKEIMDFNFAFVSKLLEQQQKFVTKILSTTTQTG
jgi:hypothetical protein